MEIKYDKIGIRYNETRKADNYLANRLCYHLNPKKEGLYLDIGCGTGNYTNVFSKKGFHFIGIDPSRKMLDKAKKKNTKITWKLGEAENTGLSNEIISGITASLTIHHWHDLEKSFSELSRVLKSGGTLVIFTSTPKQMKGYWLNHYFPKMMLDSMKQMPLFVDLENALLKSGFSISTKENYFVKPDLQDLFLYAGKHRPNLYFNSDVRRGISSFSSLSNKREVANGLLRMKEDIDSGKIDEVIKSFENDLGDYLFVTAHKI